MKRYYLGHWVQQRFGTDLCFAPPAGVVGSLDLAPIPVQGVMAADRPMGLFVTRSTVLPSEYTLLGEGDCRELKADTRMQDAFRSLVGYRPQGDTLAELIYDTLTDGSDPDGSSGPKPLMPDATGWCDVYLGGHSRVLGSRFEWGKPDSRGRRHWAKVQQLLRKEFEQLFDDAKAGKLKDAEHHRRVLDAHCDKYGLQGENDWKEFVPVKLQKDVPGRLKHETTITESFNKADSDTLGPDLTWTEVNGDFDVVSNQCRHTNTTTVRSARAESDLSSADHYAQVQIVSNGSGTNDCAAGACARFAAAAETMYFAFYYQADNRLYVSKKVTGAQTNITSSVITEALPETYKCEINGSTLKGYQAGVERVSTTDSAITGNLRGGILLYQSSVLNPTIDNFEASDELGGGGGILYTQLERGVRGYLRGVYSGSV